MSKTISHIILVILLSSICAFSQTHDTVYRKLSSEICLGTSYNSSTKYNPTNSQYWNWDLTGTARFMYESEYNLKIGFETGYLQITGINHQNISNEFGNSEVNAQLSAIPFLIVFTMNYKDFYINYGKGAYYMLSKVNAFGTISRSSELVAGFNIGFSYKYPINEKWKIGFDSKYYYMSDNSSSLIFVGLLANYTFANFEIIKN